MDKKSKMLGMLAVACVALSSCSVTTLLVTDNAVGTKSGSAVAKPFAKEFDYSYKKAAENGKINNIGTATFKTTFIIIGAKVETTVTGE